MPLSDLQELVDAPLSDDVMILDIDDNPRVTIGDQEVRQYLLDHFQISNRGSSEKWRELALRHCRVTTEVEHSSNFKHSGPRQGTAQPNSPCPFRPLCWLPTNLPNYRSPLWRHPSSKQQTLTPRGQVKLDLGTVLRFL